MLDLPNLYAAVSTAHFPCHVGYDVAGASPDHNRRHHRHHRQHTTATATTPGSHTHTDMPRECPLLKEENQWEIDEAAGGASAADKQKKLVAVATGAVAMALSLAYLAGTEHASESRERA